MYHMTSITIDERYKVYCAMCECTHGKECDGIHHRHVDNYRVERLPTHNTATYTYRMAALLSLNPWNLK